MLDALDRELQKRGHRFVRYADDCNIYVLSERAAHRVMESVCTFITRKLKLKVNQGKSKVCRPRECKFLGFRFVGRRKVKRSLAPQTIKRFKKRIRELTRRTRGISLASMVEGLSRYLIGWRGYFGFCETPSVLRDLDSWIRRRLRCVIWKQWKHGKKRLAALRNCGVRENQAVPTAWSSRGPWRLSRSEAVCYALPNAYFSSLGVPPLTPGR